MQKKDIQAERGEPFSVAYTDVDNTFYRQDRHDVAQELGRAASEGGYPIIAVTGNDYGGMMNRINSGELPRFDLIIGAVGTEVWALQEDGQTYAPDRFFERTLQESGYQRPEVAAKVGQFIDSMNTARPDLTIALQRAEEEAAYLRGNAAANVQPFKISCTFFASSEAEVAEFSQSTNIWFPEQKAVICEEIGYNSQLPAGQWPRKYNLDVLPITKLGAIEYTSDLLDVKQGIVAGDSGNDIDMLLQSDSLTAVVVGGAKNELRQAASAATAEKQTRWRTGEQNGSSKTVFIEDQPDQLGPDSVLHAAKVLLRAERIKQASASQ